MTQTVENGVFYARMNVFKDCEPFRTWFDRNGLRDKILVDPFAGGGHLIDHLKEIGLCGSYIAYDRAPRRDDVQKNDSLNDYKKVGDFVVTNTPHLSKSLAKRKNIIYNTKDENLYIRSLQVMLQHHDCVAAIVPIMFCHSPLFRDRLTDIVILPFSNIFNDADFAVCLALFEKTSCKTRCYHFNDFIGLEEDLANYFKMSENPFGIRFLVEEGSIGLRGLDNSKEASIAFCEGHEIEWNPKTRSLTRIAIEKPVRHDVHLIIEKANERLRVWREATKDYPMSVYRCLRNDGKYRRRLDFKQARAILTESIFLLDREFQDTMVYDNNNIFGDQ